jgi:hypothetical protein
MEKGLYSVIGGREKERIKCENSDTIACIGQCIFSMHYLFYKQRIKCVNSVTIACIGHCIFPMHCLSHKQRSWNILQEQSLVDMIT